MRAVVPVGFACNNHCVCCAQGALATGPDVRVADETVRARIERARESADTLTLVVRALENEHYIVSQAVSGAEALRMIDADMPDLVVSRRASGPPERIDAVLADLSTHTTWAGSMHWKKNFGLRTL